MKRFRYPIAIGAMLMLAVATAFAMGILYLPPDPVAVVHGPWNHGSNSTIDITLSGVPVVVPPYNVRDGDYEGWCI